MMSKIELTTLTPVHIGNGQKLMQNGDYVAYGKGDEKCLYVIDMHKILDTIGVDHVANWTSAIDRGQNVAEFVQRYAPKAVPGDYAQRDILDYSTGHKGDGSLKECIHDGRGWAYIPGSSIKGAIRTAILAKYADADAIAVNRKGVPTASSTEKRCFGGDPNSDVFRFIRVGDAYFEQRCEVALSTVNLNYRTGKNTLSDTSKAQIVEAIDADQETSFAMKIDAGYYRKVAAAWNGKIPLGLLQETFADLPSLFDLINAHTLKLLREERRQWDDIADEKDGADYYLEAIGAVIAAAEACEKGKECILRIGHASGWRFITGAWTEKSPQFKDTIVPAARRHNENYQDYFFPKTRRVEEEEGDIFGFVKLRIADGNS